MNQIYTISIDPDQDLIDQLLIALNSHSKIKAELTPALIEKLLPQVVHQSLVDETVRAFVGGIYLKRTKVVIKNNSLYFDISAILDFVGIASFLGENKNGLIEGEITMVSEFAKIQTIDITISNLGMFQKGFFNNYKSSIIKTILKTDLQNTLIAALQKEGLPVLNAELRIGESSVDIIIESIIPH